MNWTDTIKTLAPTVASALLGPLGGAAVSAIGGILGLDQPTQSTIEKAIIGSQLTADQAAELRKLEMQYQNDEKERGFRYVELEFKDIASARDMQNINKSNVPALLTMAITIGFFSILAAMMYFPAAKESGPLLVMLGSLGTAWTTSCSFWFGTTHGSGQKTDLLAQAEPIK